MLKRSATFLALLLCATFAVAAEPPNGAVDPGSPEGPIELVWPEWFNFNWGAGEPAPVAQTFTYTAPIATTVTVVDAFCTGDRFEVFVDAASVGTTSAPGSATCSPPEEAEDPDVALTLPDYSRGTFAVPAGTHTVTMTVTANPFDGGGAFIRLGEPSDLTTVPTLSTVGLATLIGALALGGALLIFRRRTA